MASKEMSNEIRERLMRLETKGEHHSESLDSIQAVLEDLVHYTARNEDNKEHISDLEDRMGALERRMNETESWLRSRVWFATTAMGLVIAVIEILFRVL
jgi:predicted  nucleic acid-binding Zn-ribbon protein